MGFFYSQFFVTPSYPTTSFVGQTVIVTGSNIGLGKEAARHIVRLGAAKVILAVRNANAGEEAKKDIETTTNCASSTIEVWNLDLSSYDSVKEFANRATKLPRLDVLLENAGIAGWEFSRINGHERMIAINVISTFLLGLLLLPKLKSSAKEFGSKPRLDVVVSEVHGHTEFKERNEPRIFEALDIESKASMSERYPISKLLQVLTVQKLARMLEGSGVIINMLNPGLCHSGLARDGGWFLAIMKFFVARSTEVGSRTLVAAAAAGEASHGKYMSDGLVDESALSAFARSEEGRETSEKIWKELSEILETIQPGVTKNI